MIQMSISTKSLFISFEGIDGCGKSTQVNLLMDKLANEKNDSILVREPGGTPISEEIRQILLNDRNDELAARTEALLMTASRAQLTKELIIPALKKGTYVIADRYKDSTVAYQGGGRNLDLDYLIQLNDFATYGLDPDITFFIDVTIEEGNRRRNFDSPDRIEKAGMEFQEKVRDQYFELVNLFPDRIIVIDGSQSPDMIGQTIWNTIQTRIS